MKKLYRIEFYWLEKEKIKHGINYDLTLEDIKKRLLWSENKSDFIQEKTSLYEVLIDIDNDKTESKKLDISRLINIPEKIENNYDSIKHWNIELQNQLKKNIMKGKK